VAVGENSLLSNTTAGRDMATGVSAPATNTTGSENTAAGHSALFANTTGIENTALGYAAGQGLTTGNNNLALGSHAGENVTTGSDNINIANPGGANPAESNTTRIGSAQTRAFIAGVRGTVTDVNDAIPVLIDSQGQLGTVSSSRRYKEDIHAMGSASDPIMRLRPVTFRYRSNPSGLRYGLIAEQVAKVMPNLAVYDRNGLPETVKYQDLPVLLLNKVQQQQRALREQRRQNDALRAQNRSQQTQIDWLMRRARGR
jgi:hypothetical protein